ncbi:hypothetical protein [Kribbella ginsengisoli]|uniref:hypothetical protein n=1 Tax=Kribbella ginsengisoli TaxID=363865 RepID=UPI0031E32343
MHIAADAIGGVRTVGGGHAGQRARVFEFVQVADTRRTGPQPQVGHQLGAGAVPLRSAGGSVAEDRSRLVGRGVVHPNRGRLVLDQVAHLEPPALHRATGQRHEGDHGQRLIRPCLLALLVRLG